MAAVTAGTVLPVSAQDYPSKPVRIIVPAGVTSVGDIVARLLSIHMAKAMGQPFIVENLPVASGIPGTDKMIRSPKDGYTVGIISNNHAINPAIRKDLPYDSLKDITPISIIGNTPLVLVTNPAFPAKDLPELLALAKAKPGGLTYGSAGAGTVLHLAGVLLVSEGNVDIRHIPYSTTGQMITDIAGGQIDMGFLGVASALGQIQGGKMRAIGVTTRTRSAILPAAPTFAESGLPNYSFDGWLALVGPAGLPKPIVDRLHAELKAALALPEVRDTMAAQGVMIIANSPEAATQFFASEVDKHMKLVKTSGAKVE
ncbi:MAG: tripartite tricarboxylate transporter substrate binding protein [Burkholderiales bacterium]|nr:tripartite tricarboxylate transporter substrate binding protein [Burkholderiales bacterium]